MFLQRHKNSNSNELPFPQKQPIALFNISNIRSKRQFSEIKQHQKAFNYTNARSYLIENTKRVIKQKKCQNHQKCHTLQTTTQIWSSLLQNRKLTPNNHFDASMRQSRRMAISNFRKKIWKSNQMSPLVKFQQKKITLTQRVYNDSRANQSQQKIRRYKDTIPIEIQQLEFSRQNIKNQWIQRTYQRSRRANNKNPQTINTDRRQSKQMKNKSVQKTLIQTNLSMRHYLNLLQEETRPKTAGSMNGNKKRMSDSIIQLEPW